jgi:hypothetical protein
MSSASVLTLSTTGDCQTHTFVRVRITVTLLRAVYRQSVRSGDKPLETHGQHFLFQLNTWGYSPYVTYSLTKRWVCRLQLLLVLASVVILRFESCRTRFEIPPTWRARSPYLYPPGIQWSNYTPRNWIPFRHLLRLAGLLWRESSPPPHGGFSYNNSARTAHITQFLCCVRVFCDAHVIAT